MKPEAFRANMAGYLDSAATLINQVQAAIGEGAAIKTKAGPKVNCPPAMLDQLREAVERIDRCSEWLVSEHNTGFENG
ncbi:MAG: hypothetical protein EBR82_83950 [Caulobacteraceae bacterium]|nr:hypothetical protein [Caulobacteraceae bacterium]